MLKNDIFLDIFWYERVHAQKRDDNVSTLRPTDSFSVIMWPAQGFEFDMPALKLRKKNNEFQTFFFCFFDRGVAFHSNFWSDKQNKDEREREKLFWFKTLFWLQQKVILISFYYNINHRHHSQDIKASWKIFSFDLLFLDKWRSTSLNNSAQNVYFFLVILSNFSVQSPI